MRAKISIFFFSSLSEIHAKLTREKFYEGMRNEKNFEAICAYIYLKKTFVALIEKQLYYVNGRKHNSSLFLLDLIDFLTTSHKKKGYEMKFKFFLRIRQR